jgi:membrane associated rhomboid family serine protease
VGLVALPFVVAAANKWNTTHESVKLLVAYSPERFVHGAVWTLPLSALITATVTHVRLDILVMILLMAPYLLLAGVLRTIVRFFAGHIGCTLFILIAIVAGSAAGWATATKLYSTSDVGVSAGAAAVGGAFAVLLWRARIRWLALPALAIPLYFYTYRIATEPATALMADCEHLIAFAIGITIELRWPMRSWPERPTVSPSTTDPPPLLLEEQ